MNESRHDFYAYSLRLVWNKSHVDDVFSQSMLTAWEKRSSFRKGSNFRAWVFRIITLTSFSNNRKEHPKNVIRLEDFNGTHVLEDTKPDLVEFSDQWLDYCHEEIPRALARLGEKERSCLLLKSVEGYSYREIAEVVDIPLGTVMTHLHRARKKMKAWLGDFYPRAESKPGEKHVGKKLER